MTNVEPSSVLTVANASAQASSAMLQHLPALALVSEFTPARERVERFISQVFQASFNAKIMTYAPDLLYLEHDLRIQAALGLRWADKHPLFCEKYLEGSILDAIGDPLLERGEVVELSNLASMTPGAGAQLYVLAAVALDLAGCKQLVFTANETVRRSISRGGFSARFLADANVEKITGADQWGSYYQGRPQVMVADIPASAQIIRSNPLVTPLLNVAMPAMRQFALAWNQA